jgi:hypothetical protein
MIEKKQSSTPSIQEERKRAESQYQEMQIEQEPKIQLSRQQAMNKQQTELKRLGLDNPVKLKKMEEKILEKLKRKTPHGILSAVIRDKKKYTDTNVTKKK